MSEEPARRRRQREGEEEEETGAQKKADAVAEVADDGEEGAQKALDEELLDLCFDGTREHVEGALKRGQLDIHRQKGEDGADACLLEE